MNTIVHAMHGVPYDFYGGRRNPRVPDHLVVGWGNPFVLFTGGERGKTLSDYVLWLCYDANDVVLAAQAEGLHEKIGACWCAGKDGLAIDDPLHCHLQVLMHAARGDYDEWFARLRSARRAAAPGSRPADTPCAQPDRSY